MKEKTVIFDVNRTLIKGDTLLLAAKCSSNNVSLLFRSFYFIPYMLIANLGIIKTKYLKERFLTIFKICEYINTDNNKEYINILLSNIRKDALERLYFHKDRGDDVFLCSASPQMLLQPLADFLGVKLICTELFNIDGLWQPKIKGFNCTGSEKLRRIELIKGSSANIELEVYGDSTDDKQILKAAAIPHYRSFKSFPVPYPLITFMGLIPTLILVIILYFILGLIFKGSQIYNVIIIIWPTILKGLFLVFVGYIIRFVRWRFFLNILNINLPILSDFRLWMGSYAFTATPGKSGETIRCLLFKKDFNLDYIITFSALVLERITDLLAVIIFISLNIPLFLSWDILIPISYSFKLIVFPLLLCTLLFIFLRKFIALLFIKLKKNILSIYNLKKLINLKRKTYKIFTPFVILVSTLLSIAAWSLEGVSLYIILEELNSSISLQGSIIAHTTSGLLGALSFTPGGIGTSEISTLGFLSIQGVPTNVGIHATLLIRLMTLWFATVLGVICLLLPFKESG